MLHDDAPNDCQATDWLSRVVATDLLTETGRLAVRRQTATAVGTWLVLPY